MLISKNRLQKNTLTEKLYGRFNPVLNYSDYELLKSIEKNGIQEPLVVTKDYYIISGNRRLEASKKLANIQQIEVIVKDIKYEDVDELMIITHQIQRIKDEITVAWEYERLGQLYGLKQGVKNKEEEIKEREKILSKSRISRKTVDRVLEAKRYYIQLHKCKEEKAWGYLKQQRLEKNLSVDAIRKRILIELSEKRNLEIINKHQSYKHDWFRIYKRENVNLKDIIKDGEVDCVMTSPPYYNLRNYVEDVKKPLRGKKVNTLKKSNVKEKKQLGQEDTPEEFIDNLMKSFRECIRTLKDTGSIWVNIMDVRRDGELLEIPSELIRAFKVEGMKCVEKCIWVKINPPFNNSKTFQSSEEYILHFVKDTRKYKWYNSWFGSEDEFLGKITYGDKEKNRRFKNIFLYPNPKEDGVGIANGVIETNVINNSYLVKLMKRNGLKLQHSALFPLEIPMICILSTSERGDTVMDNFSGMATTGLVAYAHGCKYYGIEISNEYAVQSEIRLKDFLENNPHLEVPRSRAFLK